MIVFTVPLVIIAKAGGENSAGKEVVKILVTLTDTGRIALGDKVSVAIVVVFRNHFVLICFVITQLDAMNTALFITCKLEGFAPVAVYAR